MPIPPISRTLLAVVRHGRTAWNEAGLIQGRSDQPLSRAGIDEVERLLPQLAIAKWDLVITSPLGRAKQTGKIISDHFGCPNCEDLRLIERAYGPAEGLSIDEAKVQYPIDAEVFGRELVSDVALRGAAALMEVAVANLGKRVVVVSHGELISSSLRQVGVALDVADARISTGSVRFISYQEGRFEQVSM